MFADVLTQGGTEAQEPAVLLHAWRDPLRDKIREVGRGLSLADTGTGPIPPVTVFRVKAYSGGVLARARFEGLRYLST